MLSLLQPSKTLFQMSVKGISFPKYIFLLIFTSMSITTCPKLKLRFVDFMYSLMHIILSTSSEFCFERLKQYSYIQRSRESLSYSGTCVCQLIEHYQKIYQFIELDIMTWPVTILQCCNSNTLHFQHNQHNCWLFVSLDLYLLTTDFYRILQQKYKTIRSCVCVCVRISTK